MNGDSRTAAKIGRLGLTIALGVLALIAVIVATASAAGPVPGAAPGLAVTVPAATRAPIASPAPAATPRATPSPTASAGSGSLPPDGGADAPISGEWRVTYGSPSVVTISGSDGSYTQVAKSPIQVQGSSCFLPPGTTTATFSGSGRAFTGQHGLWFSSNCAFAHWTPVTVTLAGMTLTEVLGDGEHFVFTRIGNLPPLPFRESVPTPAQITFDPVIVAQSLAIVVGIIILVPFPAILFNRTLEENYAEIVGRVRRARRRLTTRRALAALFGLLPLAANRGPQTPSAAPAGAPPSPGIERIPEAVRTDPPSEQPIGSRFWGTPLGIALFVLLSALLYGFLDPTFGPDLQSLAAFAGLVLGLVVTLSAFCVPIELAYRRSAIGHSLRALPGTLVVGLACVLITRLTDFHPGYLYGLVLTFVVARDLGIAAEGRAMMRAAASTLAIAVVSWLGLWLVDVLVPVQSDPGPALIALQNALVMALVAGIELTVFGMLPLRFLPGEKVFRWSRRAWAALFGAGLFGFVHVLMNPRSGYLADTTRTPMVTIVVLLLGAAVFSVGFWAYFRFRRLPVARSVEP